MSVDGSAGGTVGASGGVFVPRRMMNRMEDCSFLIGISASRDVFLELVAMY
jgi:hypothetical protein